MKIIGKCQFKFLSLYFSFMVPISFSPTTTTRQMNEWMNVYTLANLLQNNNLILVHCT